MIFSIFRDRQSSALRTWSTSISSAKVDEEAIDADIDLLSELHDDLFYWRLEGAIEIHPLTGINGKLNLWALDTPSAKEVADALVNGVRAMPLKGKRTDRTALVEYLQEEEEEEEEEALDPITVRAMPPLDAIVGRKPLSREELVTKVWHYIKKHDLQDKKNPRMIQADAKLKPIFGRQTLSMFSMTTRLAKFLEAVE